MIKEFVTFDKVVDAYYKRIDCLLEKRNWSVSKLATMAEVPDGTLYSSKKRKSIPKLDTILKVCSALGITIAEFFDDPIFDELSITEK